MEALFSSAVDLHRCIGDILLASGADLRTELKVGSGVSLWDVFAPNLVLYRFPLIAQKDLPFYLLMQQKIRINKGWIGGLVNSLLPSRKHKHDGIRDQDGNKPLIMFVGFHETFYRDVLKPVAQLVADQADFAVSVLTDHDRAKCGYAQGVSPIQFRSCREYWSGAVASDAKRMLAQLKKVRHMINSNFELKQFIMDLNAKVNSKLLMSELNFYFMTAFKASVRHMAIARHIMCHCRPALVVYADDTDYLDRVYSLSARAYGVPTLVIQQGVCGSSYPDWKYFSADMVAAMGKQSYDVMVSQGVPEERIVITGHPGFDRLLNNRISSVKPLCDKINRHNGKVNVLFASQPYVIGAFSSPEARATMIRAIASASNSLNNINLIVKPHPSDNDGKLKYLFRGSKVLFADKNMDISLLIKISDVVITFFSQSGLQALYLGKPVINVAFSGACIPKMYTEYNATWFATSEAEIIDRINALCGDSRMSAMSEREAEIKRFVYDYAYLPDGNAAQRVVDIIYKTTAVNTH